jgi:signal peptidase I
MKLPKFSGKQRKLKRANLIIIRRVIGSSMLPSLSAGEVILARPVRKIRIGDVVIIRHEGLEKIKRVTYLKDDQVFVSGDNPEASKDSRQFGWLARKDIIAKLVWPRLTRLPPKTPKIL